MFVLIFENWNSPKHSIACWRVWNMFGRCWGGVGDMRGRCVGRLRDMFGGIIGDIWEVDYKAGLNMWGSTYKATVQSMWTNMLTRIYKSKHMWTGWKTKCLFGGVVVFVRGCATINKAGTLKAGRQIEATPVIGFVIEPGFPPTYEEELYM